MDEFTLTSAEGDDNVQTDTENKMRGWGWGMGLVDNRVAMRSDCDVPCLDISGYVTAGNGRLVSGYLCFLGNNDTHRQGTNNVTITTNNFEGPHRIIPFSCYYDFKLEIRATICGLHTLITHSYT